MRLSLRENCQIQQLKKKKKAFKDWKYLGLRVIGWTMHPDFLTISALIVLTRAAPKATQTPAMFSCQSIIPIPSNTNN